MNKYKLINKQTGEEHLCNKVTIDGFDYYVSDYNIQEIYPHQLVVEKRIDSTLFIMQIDNINDVDETNQRKIIATNNPNIDIPKVVDEVEELAKHEHNFNHKSVNEISFRLGFEEGYNKSQETHSFSEEDMIEFYKWVNQPHPEDIKQPTAVYVKNIDMWWYKHKKYTSKEILKLWKEQKTKVIYYND